MIVQSVREMGKDFCPNFLQPFLENIDWRNCNNGSRELIPVFHNPHRKFRPSPSAVARTLEYLVGAASSGREEKHFVCMWGGTSHPSFFGGLIKWGIFGGFICYFAAYNLSAGLRGYVERPSGASSALSFKVWTALCSLYSSPILVFLRGLRKKHLAWYKATFGKHAFYWVGKVGYCF